MRDGLRPIGETFAWIALTVVLSGCASIHPVGNTSVPQPAKSVDIARYSGLWYELARYENRFEKNCEGVTAQYTAKPDGEIRVLNSCRAGSIDGELRTSEGNARIVPGSDGAKLKVSFFGPFYLGNYWVLDRAPDYTWAIIGEPSGRYLWLLSRTKSQSGRSDLTKRAARLGYDVSLLRWTKQ